jgi:hypothetical protein
MIGCEVLVIVESSISVPTNPELVETCRRYVPAPVEAFQIKVGLVEILTAASGGATNTGAAGSATLVVKLHTVE